MSFIRKLINRFFKPSVRVVTWEEFAGITPEVVHPSTPAGWRTVGRYCGR